MKRTIALLLVLCSGSLLFAQQDDRTLWTEAERRFQSQDYELAIDRYDALIAEYPVSPYLADSQFRKSVALYHLQRRDDALELLDLVERRYRSTRWLGYVPFWRGLLYYELGRQADSLEQFRTFLETQSAVGTSDPGVYRQALLYRALVEVELGDTDAAASSLEDLIDRAVSPEDEAYALTLLLSLHAAAARYDSIERRYSSLNVEHVDPRYRARIRLYAAEMLNGTGRFAEAAEQFRGLLDTEPEVIAVAYQRLFQYAQRGVINESPADVLRQAEQALAGQAEVLKELWLRVGIDSFERDQFDLAELYFRRIWDFRGREEIPASVALYLSRLLDRRGDIRGAADVLQEYLDLRPESTSEQVRVLVALGNFQSRTGDYSAAVATLSRAVSAASGGEYAGIASYQYAFALWKSGAPDDALPVIASVFETGNTEGIRAELLRLRARILSERGDQDGALQALFEYLPLRPSDADAAVEYVSLLYSLGRYDRVVDEVPNIIEELEDAGRASEETRIKLEYTQGLAFLNNREYAQAAARFESVLLRSTRVEDSDELASYALYYRGWAAYRQGRYEPAAADFTSLPETHPDHPLAARANYLAGWSYFRLARFDEAARSLARVRSYAVTEELAIESSYLLGRSLVSAGSVQQAAAEYRSLYLNYPESSYADDAWFEYGQAQAAAGNIRGAVAAFDELARLYPTSELRPDALFRKAELLFGSADYASARDAYFVYRTEFPDGKRFDEALFWGGEASAELGETAGAILLWERLVTGYRSSPYRADAMQKAARLYSERGDYRQALNLYTELQASYPEIARAAGAPRRIDELVLLISGLSQREAELYVTIESSGADATDAGRQAIIELARLAIYEDTATGTDAGTVIPLLEAVAQRRSEAPAYASQSLFLLGEYHSRQREYAKAADRYLEAAAASTADRDLAALSIYRAAEMYSIRGLNRETETLLRRLEEEFPGSQWLEEARGLQGGSR